MTKKSDSKLTAWVTTFLSIIGFILAIILWKKDKYTMYYARQSISLFVIAIIIAVVNVVLVFIPFIGVVLVNLLNILVFVLWLLTWIFALTGEKKKIFLVSDLAEKFKI